MAAVTRGNTDDSRRSGLSPRPKGRETAKDTLCRNVTIYGHCRYEEKGCAFNHEPVKAQAVPADSDGGSARRRLNVDSPSFTPASRISPTLAVNGSAKKGNGLSPKAANAAPFEPKGLGSGSGGSGTELGVFQKKPYNPAAPDWALGPSPEIPEFLPQSHSVTPTISQGHRRYHSSHEKPVLRTSHPPRRSASLTDELLPSPSLASSNMHTKSLSSDTEPFLPRQWYSSKTLSADATPFNPLRGPSPLRNYHKFRELPPDMDFLTPPPRVPFPRLHSSPSHFPYHVNPVLPEAQCSYQGETNGGLHQGLYDPYASPASSIVAPSHNSQQAQINPYSQDATATAGASYYQNSSFTQPIQYHLYTSLGPHRENLLPYQRASHDFFIPDTFREELQRKAAATLQTLPNSTLPPQIEHFHSLVPLDTTNQKNAVLFGYPSWIYKAASSKDGHTYALRRLEGYRLTNEKAIRSVQNWKRISNGNVVTVIDAFTNRSFGDSSLIFVTDYHPQSKTLAEVHFTATPRYNNRTQGSHVTEQLLWGYIVQIANALKTIHSNSLAARLIDPSKVLVTSQNRLRLNACAILDVVQYDSPRTLIDLQREDLLQFGRLLLSIATNNPSVTQTMPKALEQFSRSYSPQLKERVSWLLSMVTPNKIESIDKFIASIDSHLLSAFDATLHLNDALTSDLNRELENSRIVRLMTKLNFITERPDLSQQWSETGERFHVKLFRDYVFHQVDAQGNPVLDLGHVLGCLNKLDAGVEEKIVLTTRDDQVVIVVTFKEMKRAVENAYQELVKAGRRGL